MLAAPVKDTLEDLHYSQKLYVLYPALRAACMLKQVLLFSVISSTAAEAPSAEAALSVCNKYANRLQHGTCQQLLAQLTQEVPSAGPATVTGSPATGILHS